MNIGEVIREGVDQLQQKFRQEVNGSPKILELDLTKGILDARPSNPMSWLRVRQMPTLTAILTGLRQAAKDPQVVGLIVDLGPGQVTPTQAEEIGELIADFGKHKPTVAFAPSFGELSNGLWAYRLASAAQQVWVQPSGALTLAGVHAELVLLRGGLDKLGVDPEFGQRHEYKNAADQFAAREITKANRESTQRLVDSLLESATQFVADARDQAQTQVRDAVDESPISPDDALEQKLIDRIGYRDEVYAWAKSTWGATQLQYVHRYAERTGQLNVLRHKLKPAVGVVSITGPITLGAGQPVGLSGPSAGSDLVCAALRAAARDDRVKSVVLRVDSPGGSYAASDAIRREVLQLREHKPVVAAMGAVAASGGYCVAMPCREIVANPSTLTGSIGVLGGKFTTQGLYDKLGLVREAIDAGAQAGMMAATQPFTKKQWATLNRWLDQVYAEFTSKAASDRGMDLDDLEPLARGRVWTGADAQQRGLVDHLGGLDRAIERACALAEVDRDELTVRPVPLLGPLSQLRGVDNSEALGAGQAGTFGTEGLLRQVVTALGLPYVGVLSMPYQIRLR